MRNITFSAREEAIEKARKVAAQQNRTLNDLFREWLEEMNSRVKKEHITNKLETLWSQTSYLRVGKKVTREEMNDTRFV